MNGYVTVYARGFLMVSLVASNTAQIAGRHYVGAFLVGSAISWLWFGNARVAGRTDLRHARVAYALGAACGTVFAMWAMKAIYG